LARVPILIAGEGPLYNAHTAVVNCHGALILSPENFAEGKNLEIQNQTTGESAKVRVVWSGGENRPGLYKLGIELLDELPEFWGVDYATAVAAPPQS
jgi:hypothetical protein